MNETIHEAQSDFLRDSELVRTLQEVDPQTAQEMLNERFSLESRQEKLQHASRDIKGRKVRYYRYMAWPVFLHIFSKRQLSAEDYFDPGVKRARRYKTATEEVAKADLYRLLVDYRIHEDSKNAQTDRQVLKELILQSSDTARLLAFLEEIFPDSQKAEIENAFALPTYASVIPFIEKYVPLQVRMDLHSGSMSQKFSQLLSISVGGILQLRLDFAQKEDQFSQVYVEMTLPEDRVLPYRTADQGEKEAFTRSILLEDVTRVFNNDEQTIREVIQDPTSAVGHYYRTHEYPESVDWNQVLQDWRFSEQTEECLPAALSVLK